MTRRLKFRDSPIFEEISNAQTGVRIRRLLDPGPFFLKDRPISSKIK
jgi:hypothetical protein